MNKEELLSFAKNAAYQVGAFLQENSVDLKRVNLEIGRDIKIEADVRSEAMIIELLSKETKFPILSEEKGLVPG
ncbi:MAG: inositol monophosphatase, partial [Candidatus Omnitrophica bacterium]|nr:inositol monophosphatase [Candidatus Omnitrophota bacterium]